MISEASGRKVRVVTKGFLPYWLRFQFRLTQVEYPSYFSLEARGDFKGRGQGWLSAAADQVSIHFDWQLQVGKPLLRRWSWLLKPLFIANHRWLMAQGQTGLRQELSERRVVPAFAS